jgi:hypothetical protein
VRCARATREERKSSVAEQRDAAGASKDWRPDRERERETRRSEPEVARQGTETACCETSGKGEGEEEGEESVVGQQPARERERRVPLPFAFPGACRRSTRQADARAEGQAGLSLSLQRCRGRPAEAQREVQHRPPRNRRACAAASLRRPCHLARRGHVRAALPIAAPVLAVCCSCAGRRPCG